MDFEFAIPIKLSNLQKKSGVRDYVVNEVFPARVIPNKLAELKTANKSFGKETVIDHFDTLYSVLGNSTAFTDASIQEAAWAVLLKSTENLTLLLKGQLDGGHSLHDAALRNSVSMCLYIFTEYVTFLETESTKPSTEQMVAGKKKRTKAKTLDNLTIDWPYERQKAVRVLTHMISLPIQRLWDPPMVDQAVITCVGNCVFKLLDNPETVKQKESKEAIFRLLGCLIKRHKYSLSAAIQIMERLKIYEHMAGTMAQALAVISREFSIKQTAQEVLREMSSLSSDYLLKDTAACRAYSTFLVDLTDMIPDVVLPSIVTLLHFLTSDPHTMRNAMLTVLGRLVMNLLTGDNLDENQKNLREEFLDTLCEHMHDINGFVRAKVLQIMTSVVEAKTLPVSRYIEVTDLVRGRLQDKLPNVRKNAVLLMITLMSHNPYGAELSQANVVKALTTEKNKLADLQSKVTTPVPGHVISHEENWTAMTPEINQAITELVRAETMEDDEKSLDDDLTVDGVIESITRALQECRHADAVRELLDCQEQFADSPLEMEPLDEDNDNIEWRVFNKLRELFINQKVPELTEQPSAEEAELRENITKQQLVVRYLEQTHAFCEQIQKTMPVICALLTSKSPSDVILAIQFVINSVQFGVTDGMQGLATMLNLIWVNDAAIKKAVVDSFRQLYLYSDESGNAREPDRVVSSLISLTVTFGQLFGLLTSWEEMVAEFVRSEDISAKVLQLLWQKFTTDKSGENRVALQLLAMAARANPGIIRSNLDTLISEGLYERASTNFLFCRDVCFALLALVAEKSDTGRKRLPADHAVVSQLVSIMKEGIANQEQAGWVPMMEQATKVIYSLTATPDSTMANLIRELAPQTLTPTINTGILTRFVSLVGQVAICQVTYLEGDVLQELKIRRKSNKTAETTGGDELGTTQSDDVETEVVLKVIEMELLKDGNLLAAFLPLLTHILSNPKIFDDKALQAATVLALGKYMLISPSNCQQNLRLYFTILEKSNYTTVRSNAITSLSDMVFRFPNEIEPWTPNLYARLRDESAAVRKCTLIVMTRLILNDMVKVKGQISEIAVCLVDEEHQIRQLAMQFFSELANKGRALYNVVLDIVSRLSDPDVGVDEEKFRVICTTLFDRLKNDKQTDTLMERFILRFQATGDERQWRDLAFCLSQLSYTEKAIRKMLELFSCYADKLADNNIYESFLSILSTATNSLKNKPTAKEVITELAAKLEVAHTRGIEDTDALDNAVANAANTTVNKKRRDSRAPKRSRRKTRTSVAGSDSDSDMSDSSRLSASQSNTSVCQRRSTRKAPPKKPLQNLLEGLDEESSEDDLPVFTKAKSKAVAEKKKLFSSSEDELEISAADILTPQKPRRGRRGKH